MSKVLVSWTPVSVRFIIEVSDLTADALFFYFPTGSLPTIILHRDVLAPLENQIKLSNE